MLMYFFVFLLSLLIAFNVIKISKMVNVGLDSNLEGDQKFHKEPIPRIGGISVFVSFVFGMLLLTLYTHNINYPLLFVASATPIFLAGLVEDITGSVSAMNRLLLTILSSALAFWFLGAEIRSLGLDVVDIALKINIISFLVTLLIVSGITQSINIIDGFNGLMPGVSIIAALAIAYAGFLAGDGFVATMATTLAVSIAGVMILNFPFGKIFMGDGGAYFIGFALAEISILLVHRNEDISPWFPVVILAYPIMETLFSMYRKKIIRKASIMEPDKLHLHMLVYDRIICKVYKRSDAYLANSMTSPVMWLLSLITVFPAIILREHTIGLISLFVYFSVVYVYIYVKIIRNSTGIKPYAGCRKIGKASQLEIMNDMK